ncbi:MAG: rhodanese-like domain-containing protein [bacterium]
MTVREISSEELKKLLDGGTELVLIDLLGEKSYDSLHLPQAASVPPDDDFMSRVEGLAGGDRGRKVVLYGANFKDDVSTRQAEVLMQAGFSDVLDFRGGLKDWAAELYPLEGQRAPKR